MFENLIKKSHVFHVAQDWIWSDPKIWKAMTPGTLIKAEIQNASCHCSKELLLFRSLPVVTGARNPEVLESVFDIAEV